MHVNCIDSVSQSGGGNCLISCDVLWCKKWNSICRKNKVNTVIINYHLCKIFNQLVCFSPCPFTNYTYNLLLFLRVKIRIQCAPHLLLKKQGNAYQTLSLVQQELLNEWRHNHGAGMRGWGWGSVSLSCLWRNHESLLFWWKCGYTHITILNINCHYQTFSAFCDLSCRKKVRCSSRSKSENKTTVIPPTWIECE